MTQLVPTAEIAQLLEVPETPTNAWTNVMHPSALPHGNRRGQSMESVRDEGSITHLLTDDHILLNLEAANRDSLLARLGAFLEQFHGIKATLSWQGSLRAKRWARPRSGRVWRSRMDRSAGFMAPSQFMCARSCQFHSTHRTGNPSPIWSCCSCRSGRTRRICTCSPRWRNGFATSGFASSFTPVRTRMRYARFSPNSSRTRYSVACNEAPFYPTFIGSNTICRPCK